MQRRLIEPLRLLGSPAYSRAGSICRGLATAWIPLGSFGVMVTTNAAGIADSPIWLRWTALASIFLVGLGPFAFWYVPKSSLGRRFAGRRIFAWMFAAVQPGA